MPAVWVVWAFLIIPKIGLACFPDGILMEKESQVMIEHLSGEGGAGEGGKVQEEEEERSKSRWKGGDGGRVTTSMRRRGRRGGRGGRGGEREGKEQISGNLSTEL